MYLAYTPSTRAPFLCHISVLGLVLAESCTTHCTVAVAVPHELEDGQKKFYDIFPRDDIVRLRTLLTRDGTKCIRNEIVRIAQEDLVGLRRGQPGTVAWSAGNVKGGVGVVLTDGRDGGCLRVQGGGCQCGRCSGGGCRGWCHRGSGRRGIHGRRCGGKKGRRCDGRCRSGRGHGRCDGDWCRVRCGGGGCGDGCRRGDHG
eukprot:scaffold482_cov266-Amphora_coffeaeformis.AAC.55